MSNFLLKSADASPLVAALREALGVSPTEDVAITTPTFNRPADWLPAMLAPTETASWVATLRLSKQQLRDLGCRCFCGFTTEPPKRQDVCTPVGAAFYPVEDDGDGRYITHELMLFPAEWYASIPAGFPIVDINGKLEDFEPGKTDDDRRFGLLAYGVMVPVGR